MITFAQRVETRSRIWGHLLAAGCAPTINADDTYAAVVRRLPDDDPVLVRQVLTGCVAISAEVNLQLYRQPRPPQNSELTSVLRSLSPDLTTPNDVKTSAALMQLWSCAYTDGDPAALRRFVPVVHARTADVRRRTLVTMMVLYMHGELAQLGSFGRAVLAETFAAAPLRADARAHVLAAMWAEGTAGGDLRWQQVLLARLREVRQRVRTDLLWVCARTAAGGLMPGEQIDESDYGCECSTGQEAARWLAQFINSVAKGTPYMQAFLRSQFAAYVSRDPDMADHLLSVAVAWLARRFLT